MKKLFFIITIGVSLTVMSCSNLPENIESNSQKGVGVLAIKSPKKNLKDLMVNNNDTMSFHDTIKPLLYEETINLELHIKDTTDAKKEIQECKSFLYIGGNSIDGEIPLDTIKPRAFLKLFTEATNLLPRANPSKYLTGLKIIFGFETVENRNKLCLLFQPFCFATNSNPDSGGRRNHTGIMTNNYYKYNANVDTFQTVTNDLASNLIKGYKDSIKIKHSKVSTDSFTAFEPNIDVEWMIFSFQEIFAVIDDNRVDSTDYDFINDSNNNPVTIFNCVRRDPINPYYSTKHSLLLRSQPSEAPLIDSFKKMYGNLAHLCPPNCSPSEFTFMLERK